MLKDKIVLITGGTGSFGQAVLLRLLEAEVKEVRIFSRDEKKQHDMRIDINNESVKFFIGDVREEQSLDFAMTKVDYVFHAAALKQVPSCEFFPVEAVKTNILGTHNVIKIAKKNNVKKVVCLSTDKAAYPINAMGISKAMMEKVAVAESRESEEGTIICVTRYGNVLASRGSVIPLFTNLMKKGKTVSITNPNMTRFIMSLDEAVDLVLYAFKNGNNGDIFIQKSPSAKIETVFNALKVLMKKPEADYNVIGLRHGEKLYEALGTSEEMNKAIDEGDYFRIPPDSRSLNYNPYFEEGKDKQEVKSYDSDNTRILSLDETIDELKKSREVLKEING